MTNDFGTKIMIDDWVEQLGDSKDEVLADRSVSAFREEYGRSPDMSDEDDFEAMVEILEDQLKHMCAVETLDDLKRRGLIEATGVDDDGFYKYVLTDEGAKSIA